jgi:hypothetical protein
MLVKSFQINNDLSRCITDNTSASSYCDLGFGTPGIDDTESKNVIFSVKGIIERNSVRVGQGDCMNSFSVFKKPPRVASILARDRPAGYLSMLATFTQPYLSYLPISRSTLINCDSLKDSPLIMFGSGVRRFRDG